MLEAAEAYTEGHVSGDNPRTHVAELYAYTAAQGKKALATALRQRYPIR